MVNRNESSTVIGNMFDSVDLHTLAPVFTTLYQVLTAGFRPAPLVTVMAV